jgi:hypothetical protein
MCVQHLKEDLYFMIAAKVKIPTTTNNKADDNDG